MRPVDSGHVHDLCRQSTKSIRREWCPPNSPASLACILRASRGCQVPTRRVIDHYFHELEMIVLLSERSTLNTALRHCDGSPWRLEGPDKGSSPDIERLANSLPSSRKTRWQVRCAVLLMSQRLAQMLADLWIHTRKPASMSSVDSKLRPPPQHQIPVRAAEPAAAY